MVNGGYFTLIFFPVTILLPLMPLSWRSFFTVVPLRSAISLRVSPDFTVTCLVCSFDFLDLDFFVLLLLLVERLLFDLLRDDEAFS